MNCIIVDDEPLAIKVLEKHLSMVDGYVISATFTSALPVYKYLQENKIDLIFLDIEMPTVSGLNFLKTLSRQPKVILTTAHRKYALESYNFMITDYLLKPISFERFLKSLSKIDESQNPPKTNTVITSTRNSEDPDNYTFFKIDRNNVRVDYNDILYIESLKNHVKLVLKDASYITHVNLQTIENRLNKNHLIRVHKSYIVNINNIDSFTNTSLQLKQNLIPLGRTYKIKVLEVLNSKTF